MTFIPTDLDVTSLTPGGSPRVLNEPVLIFIVTDSEHTVVELSSTVGESTTLVAGPVGGIDSDGNRLLVDGSLKIRKLISDVLVSLDAISTSAGSGLVARTSHFGGTRGVGIGGTGVKGGLFDVSESFSHLTSLAAEVSVAICDTSALNELFFGEYGNGVVLVFEDGVGRFDGFSGGEGPAGTTLALVLDGGNVVKLNPVVGSG